MTSGPHLTSAPCFITLDGIDGVGKSTQIDQLRDHLLGLGHQVICVQDPGGTKIGKQLRAILLEGDCEMSRLTEAMLFMASRCELVQSVIRPALAAGTSVISDRFLLANVVYQSIGGEVAAEQLWQLGMLANDRLQPDLTLLLDMPARAAIERLDRPADRMESRGVEYLEAVRQEFLHQLPRSARQTAVINADQSPEEVTKEMFRIVSDRLSPRSP